MNIFSCIKQHRWKNVALAAAMVLNLAAYGVQGGTFSEGTLNASAESEALPAPTEATEEQINEVVDAGLEDLIMYRWERMTWDNYEKRTVNEGSYLSLLINEEGYAMCGTLQGNVVRGVDSPILPGLTTTETINNSHQVWNDYDYFNNNVARKASHYLKTGVRVGYTDTQIDTSYNVFYTDTDRDAVVLQYVHRSSDVKRDGLYVPEYWIGLQNADRSPITHFVWGQDKYSESCMEVKEGGDGWKSHWTFEPTATGKWWKIRMRDPGYDDEWLVCRHGYWFSADGDRKSMDDLMWYVGERVEFAMIDGDRTIEKGQVLPIGNAEFKHDDGTTSRTNGVILKNGSTITVNQGGILSISGAFLNNGTIINNGGTILIKEGGSISPFRQGSNPLQNGCGKIICTDGDIIIQQGGAVYGGLFDESANYVDFTLNGHSTLINQGLLVYGNLVLGRDARVELFETSHTYGGVHNLSIGYNGVIPKIVATKEPNFLFSYNQDIINGDGIFGAYSRETNDSFITSFIYPFLKNRTFGLSRTSKKADYPVTVISAKGATIRDGFMSSNNISVGDLTL